MATLKNTVLRTKEMEMHANMTEQNSLGKALYAKPAKLLGTMDQLFTAKNYYSDNPLSSMLMGNSKTEETIGTTAWEWELNGANTRPLVVIENVMPISDTTPGKFKQLFKIKLDENFYVPGDVIFPGSSDKKYQVRIQEEIQRAGDGTVYSVRLMTDDPQLFLPQTYLTPGTQWVKLFSQYTEADHQSGSTQYTSTIALANKMSKFRKHYKVTDYASTEVLAAEIVDGTGGKHKTWMRYAEVKFWQQWYKELERGFVYSRSTETVMGANGRPVRSGPGLQEQLQDSHTHTYSVLTTELIEEYLMDIFYGRLSPGKGRNIKGLTGEYGMLQFHRAVSDWMTKRGFVTNIETFSNKVKSPYHSNALETGFQMVRYNMANGSSLELVHNPLYDDREINTEIDPITGRPVESQRITFLDFNSEDSKSNVKIMNKKDGFAFGYVQGMVGPYGPAKGGTMAHSGSYYEMHAEKSCGLHINDVTRCGELIFGRN